MYTQAALGHSHANWGFTAEGVYDVQMQISGTLADGTTYVSSDVETFTFLVGSSTVPEPGAIALLASGVVGVLLSSRLRRRKKTKRINHLDLGESPVSSSSKQNLWVHLLGLTAVFCVAAVSSARADTLPIYRSGHAGIATKYSDGSLTMFLNVTPGCKDDAGNDLPVGEYSPDAIYIRASDAMKSTRLPGETWDFLGTDAGSDIWVMPQNNVEGLPYMGMTAGKLVANDWSGQISYSLLGVDGPGNFSVWTTDAFGAPTVYWQSSNGCDGSDSLLLNVGSAQHVNWGFTAEGVYNAQVQFSGTVAGGDAVSTAETFTFLVGSSTVPEPGTIVMLSSGAVGLALSFWKRRRSKARQT
jgi:surface-anchored protein